MLKGYKVKIETLGPVHIGSGQEIQKSEYIQDRRDDRIYVMDTYKMFKGLQRLHLAERYERFVLESQRPVLYNFIRDNAIRPEDYRQWAKYSYPSVPNADFKSIIQSCTKDVYGMPYIPGSSFKGALANAILNTMLLKKECPDIARSVENAQFKGRGRYLREEAQELQTTFFHQLREGQKNKNNAVNSFMRGLVVSDSAPLSPDDIVLCQKIDVKPGGEENKINILRECIRPNTVITLDITIDSDVLPFDEKKLDEMLRIMYDNMQKKFLSYFPDVQRTNDTAIYLGGGTGYIQKTALYSLIADRDKAVKAASSIHNNLAQNHKHLSDYAKYRVSPKTRKCTYINGKKYDMGLCKVSFQPM